MDKYESDQARQAWERLAKAWKGLNVKVSISPIMETKARYDGSSSEEMFWRQFRLDLVNQWETRAEYALAFFYACGPSRRELWLAAERERLSVAADLAVVAMERRSREALEYRG